MQTTFSPGKRLTEEELKRYCCCGMFLNAEELAKGKCDWCGDDCECVENNKRHQEQLAQFKAIRDRTIARLEMYGRVMNCSKEEMEQIHKDLRVLMHSHTLNDELAMLEWEKDNGRD